MKKTFVLVLVVALMLVAVNAFAGEEYFTEDFESYPADTGYYPDTFSDYFATSPYFAEVRNFSSSNQFFIEQEDILQTNSGESAHIAPFTHIPDETQLTVTYDFVSPIADGIVGILFGSMDPGYLFVAIYDDGSIVNLGDGPFTSIAPAGTIVPDTVYNMKIVINLVTGIGQFYIDDVQIGGDLVLIVPGMDIGSSFLIIASDGLYGNGLSAQAYFDNINVTGLYTEPAPNPRTGDTTNYMLYASLAVLIFILAGFALRRLYYMRKAKQ